MAHHGGFFEDKKRPEDNSSGLLLNSDFSDN